MLTDVKLRADLDVEALFRRQPFISYLEVVIRLYGPSVADEQEPGGQDEIIKAAFSLTAGIVHVCCNQKTQLLSGGPALPAPRHYQPPGDAVYLGVGRGVPDAERDTPEEKCCIHVPEQG